MTTTNYHTTKNQTQRFTWIERTQKGALNENVNAWSQKRPHRVLQDEENLEHRVCVVVVDSLLVFIPAGRGGVCEAFKKDCQGVFYNLESCATFAHRILRKDDVLEIV